jgi:hypothetical protein
VVATHIATSTQHAVRDDGKRATRFASGQQWTHAIPSGRYGVLFAKVTRVRVWRSALAAHIKHCRPLDRKHGADA